MSERLIFELQANLCRAMSHPSRQEILHLLFEKPKTVNEIAHQTHLGQSSVSRHLAVLRQNGIVDTERNGQEIIYRVANPKIAEVCSLMRNVLIEQVNERNKLIKKM